MQLRQVWTQGRVPWVWPWFDVDFQWHYVLSEVEEILHTPLALMQGCHVSGKCQEKTEFSPGQGVQSLNTISLGCCAQNCGNILQLSESFLLCRIRVTYGTCVGQIHGCRGNWKQTITVREDDPITHVRRTSYFLVSEISLSRSFVFPQVIVMFSILMSTTISLIIFHFQYFFININEGDGLLGEWLFHSYPFVYIYSFSHISFQGL